MSLAWLALWVTVIPIAQGWSAVAMMSGSMEPGIQTGDIVLTAPSGDTPLEAGRVIVFDNPAGTGHITHRIVTTVPSGDYVTRGDANHRVDSVPVPHHDIDGVGQVLVPVIGQPLVWAKRGQWLHLAATATAVAAMAWASIWTRPALGDRNVHPSPERNPRTPATPMITAGVVVAAGIFAAATVTNISHSDAAFTAATESNNNLLGTDTLDPPSSLIASGTGSVTLDWTATTDTYASGHRVYRASNPGGPYIQIADIAPRTTVTYVDSPQGGTYYYVARAYAGTWESVDSNEVTANVSTATVVYLHNDPSPPVGNTTSQETLPLDFTAPTATALYNYDTDRDSSSGLAVFKGDGLNETDPSKYQRWRLNTAVDFDLKGTAQLVIWTAARDFESDTKGAIEVGLYDCSASGDSCILLTSTSLADGPWAATVEEKTINLGAVGHTITAGRSMVIKIATIDPSEDELWFAYDTTTYPSRLQIG